MIGGISKPDFTMSRLSNELLSETYF